MSDDTLHRQRDAAQRAVTAASERLMGFIHGESPGEPAMVGFAAVLPPAVTREEFTAACEALTAAEGRLRAIDAMIERERREAAARSRETDAERRRQAMPQASRMRAHALELFEAFAIAQAEHQRFCRENGLTATGGLSAMGNGDGLIGIARRHGLNERLLLR